MKSNRKFNKKLIISILSIILFVLILFFLTNFKYKLLEANDMDDAGDLKDEGESRADDVVEGEPQGNEYKDKVDKAINNTTPNLYDEEGNPDIIDDSTLTNEYMDAIKSPKELQQEMTDSNDVLNTMSYLSRGLNYAKIFISADNSNKSKYSVIKDGKTLGKEQIVETNKNCTHCYNYDNANNTWQTCTQPAYKIVNNIPQSKNGIIPGILENVLRVMPSPAIDLIVPKVKVEKTSDLLKIKNNDIKCVNYDTSWVMIDGMYDIPYNYKDHNNTYQTGSTQDIKGIKEKFKKQEQFSNLNDNNEHDDIIINLYYFSLVCFFIYIITKLMIKQ